MDEKLQPQSEESASAPGLWLYDMDELRRVAANIEELRKHIADINPRPPGWHNQLLQLPKKLLARSLAWYTRSLQKFNSSVSRSLGELLYAVETLSANMAAFDGRCTMTEKRISILVESMELELQSLQEQVNTLIGLQQNSTPEALARGAGRVPDYHRLSMPERLGNDRTFYVIGLFGTGRLYVNDLIVHNIGERAKYFRDQIRLHPGPTSMIYSGHVTVQHISRAQSLPVIMKGVSHAIRAGFADSMFICRHPLDSLLTNWAWWRTYLDEGRAISGISSIYKDDDDLCANLEQNFVEFRAFAEGNPFFFAAAPGPPFLSFAEFVEETALHVQSASLTLRFEDFVGDPLGEFSKIAELMGASPDLSRLQLTPPRSKPYRYLVAKEKVPRFKSFIDQLDLQTANKIERVGYSLG